MTDTKHSQAAVVIERTFDAPVDLIWRMWTEPGRFKKASASGGQNNASTSSDRIANTCASVKRSG